MPDLYRDSRFGGIRRRPTPSILPLISFAAATYECADDIGQTSVEVKRTRNSIGACSVQFHTVASSAIADVDFEAASGTLSWSDGDSTSRFIAVPILEPTVIKWDSATGDNVTLADADRTGTTDGGTIDSIEIAPRHGKPYGEVLFSGGAALSGGQRFIFGVYQDVDNGPFFELKSSFQASGTTAETKASGLVDTDDLPMSGVFGVLIDWQSLTLKLSIDGQYVDAVTGALNSDPDAITGQALQVDVAVKFYMQITEPV